MTNQKESLEIVFGPESKGDTEIERARSSRRLFVRSQLQIASASEKAKGRVLTASEALAAFGPQVLLKVAQEGAAPLVSDGAEPAATLKARRVELGLSPESVAKRAKIDVDTLLKAEEPGNLNPIRTLESIAQALALDEGVLGYLPNGGRDRDLGVRLRELAAIKDANFFDSNTVLGLTETAWVISKQMALVEMLDYKSPSNIYFPRRYDNYFGYPAYEAGYALARRTRELLGLSQFEPINSLRVLTEEVLEIPLIQQSLAKQFAGATIANSKVRGIVINENGMNSNVWVRRMTLCHELGHLLWDPDERLNKLKVDRYTEMDRSATDPRMDLVEMRANAFAIEFLAPHEGILRLSKQIPDTLELLAQVMTTYGISATAAKYHVANVTKRDTQGISPSILPSPSDDWIARENLAIDFFPLDETPITRRGKFAWLVALAYKKKIISADSAACFLQCNASEFTKHYQTILDLGAPQ